MPQVLEWQSADDSPEICRAAIQALKAGRLVALPTETVYGIAASALVPEAVERLSYCKGRPEEKPFTLAIGGAEEALDWVPGMSVLGRRLARRCWPGPVTLVYEGGIQGGVADQLPSGVRQRICPRGSLGLRTPAHDVVLHLLRHLAGPLVLTSANRSGEPEAISADEALRTAGAHLDLVIDGGPSRYGQPSTVVQVNGNSWKILREGVVSSTTLERLACCVIVFVCTGNTCRSPLAEALFKKRLAERLQCSEEELPQRGFIVLSAGMAAMMGGRAALEAVEVGRDLGVELSHHSSQPLTAQLFAQADQVITMTRGHFQALIAQFPARQPPPRMLCTDGTDIPDPIGYGHEVYKECARQILTHIDTLVSEVQPP